MKHIKKTQLIRAAALLAAAAIAFCALRLIDVWTRGTVRRIDRSAQDYLYQHPGVASTDILVFGIDEKALRAEGPWPWSRAVLADALMALAADPEKKPAAVAVDVLFSGASDSEQADSYLAAAAGYLGNVVTAAAAEFGDEITWEDGRAVSRRSDAVVSFISPYDALGDNTIRGHINAMLDMDGILRHALWYVEPTENERMYSMAYETARLYLQARGKTIGEPPVNAAGHFYVPYSALPDTYYDYSVEDLISGTVDPSYWAGKIVLIGPYAVALQDSYYTSVARATPMYGVEFQANVIQCILEENYKTDAQDGIQVLALFILCAAAALLFAVLKVAPGAGVCAGMICLGFALNYLLYRLGLVTHVLWLPAALLFMFVLSMALHYAQAARERRALALKEERINAELSLATRIQANALPKVFPPFPERSEFDIYASMTPAKEVGGDLYDFFLMDEDHLCMVIGDVSGKGVPASLFMMVALTLIHHVAMRERSPAKILETVNREICSRNPEEMFVTVWLGVLEISTGKLTASNAGHEYPAVKKADGHFELMKDRHGLVVGGMDIARYRDYEIPMDPGDKIFVYTDGVPEATNAAEEFYTVDRMIEALRGGEDGSPESVLNAVTASVRAFAGGAPQFDDMTMLCLAWRGSGEERNGSVSE